MSSTMSVIDEGAFEISLKNAAVFVVSTKASSLKLNKKS